MGLATFADGEHNSGLYLFALGNIFSNPDIEAATRFMQHTAAKDLVPWETWEGWELQTSQT